MKEVEAAPYATSEEPTEHVTQYQRVHDKLGKLRGPGVPLGYPLREEYNPITGEVTGIAWKEDDNRRTSGNRVLHGIRGALGTSSILR
ncbi:uncharacterized protein LOC143300776 [Babylonia areolata]|uniref:uncharacterized protein LOC143300776 n=1 Tax=Babylonia areolata TaxID=304850 RepID=UPI003FD07FA3